VRDVGGLILCHARRRRLGMYEFVTAKYKRLGLSLILYYKYMNFFFESVVIMMVSSATTKVSTEDALAVQEVIRRFAAIFRF
jgi:hypothetical protein